MVWIVSSGIIVTITVVVSSELSVVVVVVSKETKVKSAHPVYCVGIKSPCQAFLFCRISI